MPQTLPKPEADTRTAPPVETYTSRILPPTKRTPFVRWMAWLVGFALLIVVAGLVVNAVTEDSALPGVIDIDPHESPEILRTLTLQPQAVGDIDPHESPEILRTLTLQAQAVGDIDPRESPEILRTLTLQAQAVGDIDPRESPEVLRIKR